MDIENLEVFLDKIRKKLPKFQNTYQAQDIFEPGLMHSAVLVPFTYHKKELKLIFTKRSAILERHKGQVSFPGGMIETDDKNPIETALRETCEEINIRASQVEILGLLPSFNSQTGYFIYPVVGFIHDLNGLQENGDEVERIICIPYPWLADPDNSELLDFKTIEGIYKKVWFFKEFEGELLWGITAEITKDFVEIIEN